MLVSVAPLSLVRCCSSQTHHGAHLRDVGRSGKLSLLLSLNLQKDAIYFFLSSISCRHLCDCELSEGLIFQENRSDFKFQLQKLFAAGWHKLVTEDS